MLHYDSIDLREGMDLTKSNNSKERIVFHNWYFNHGFKFQSSVYNGCHDLTMLCLNLNDIAFITIKGVGYPLIIHDISESDLIFFLEN